METYPFQYYHLYNRTNNDELLFKEKKNYLYFLGKYRHYLAEFVDTHAYCLMPTHFHFLIYIKSEDIANFKRNWEFSSYPDLAGMRKGSLPKRDIIESRFGSVDEFKAFSEQLMKGIRGEYWV